MNGGDLESNPAEVRVVLDHQFVLLVYQLLNHLLQLFCIERTQDLRSTPKLP